MAKKSCPTCAAVSAVLAASRRVPRKAAKKIGYSAPVRKADTRLRRIKQVRKASKYSRKLSEHLKKERAKATKKNGQLKKGQSQAKIMAAAHRCVKRELRRMR